MSESDSIYRDYMNSSSRGNEHKELKEVYL